MDKHIHERSAFCEPARGKLSVGHKANLSPFGEQRMLILFKRAVFSEKLFPSLYFISL
jgi:hypothetical protein